MTRILGWIVLLFVLSLTAAAQEDLLPLFGRVDLRHTLSGQSPDPHLTTVFLLTQQLDTDATGLTADCAGRTTSAPAVIYTLPDTPTADLLRLLFLSYPGADAGQPALIVRGPDGALTCDTDLTLDLTFPAPGEYAVWVVNRSPDRNRVAGYLLATFNDQNTANALVSPLVGALIPESTPEPTVESVLTATPLSTPALDLPLDVAGTPLLGAGELAAGFLPDPLRVEAVSGGGVDASTLGLPAACAGFVNSVPHYRLTLTSESTRLRIMFMPNVSGDTTLIIYTPSGDWACNDDFAPGLNVNPLVELAPAPAGTYAIYLGSFTLGQTIAGAIFVTEQDVTPQG